MMSFTSTGMTTYAAARSNALAITGTLVPPLVTSVQGSDAAAGRLPERQVDENDRENTGYEANEREVLPLRFDAFVSGLHDDCLLHMVDAAAPDGGRSRHALGRGIVPRRRAGRALRQHRRETRTRTLRAYACPDLARERYSDQPSPISCEVQRTRNTMAAPPARNCSSPARRRIRRYIRPDVSSRRVAGFHVCIRPPGAALQRRCRDEDCISLGGTRDPTASAATQAPFWKGLRQRHRQLRTSSWMALECPAAGRTTADRSTPAERRSGHP